MSMSINNGGSSDIEATRESLMDLLKDVAKENGIETHWVKPKSSEEKSTSDSILQIIKEAEAKKAEGPDARIGKFKDSNPFGGL